MGIGLQQTAAAGAAIIDIAATFKALYGYLPAHIPAMPQQPIDVNPFFVQPSPPPRTQIGSQLYGDSPGQYDMLGRGVFMPITLSVGTGASAIEYNFPYSLISIKNKMLLKETPMIERGGSVIEKIATGTWEMDLKGFLIDPNNQFPDNQLTALYKLYTANTVVTLSCALTDLFLGGNYQVVISELDIPAKAKVIGVRDFSFKMIQDTILDLYKVPKLAANGTYSQ